MRKGLTFEASKDLHRRRARTLIFASVAALVLGSTVSAAVAAAWGADRRDAADARFQDVVSLQRGRIEDTVHAYRRMLTVTQGSSRSRIRPTSSSTGSPIPELPTRTRR
jgi:hypothetical protein